MKFVIPCIISCLILLLAASFISKQDDWQVLLNKNLSQWDIYQSYRHALDYTGEIPKDEKGKIIPPIGYNKNEGNVFSVSEENGEPVLRVSGEVYGCLYTKSEYENFHLKLKVKWGTKKWDPRKLKLKDSGICYFSTGKCGVDYWRTWMLSQEFQIMEGHMGDYWNISNSAIDIRAYLPEGSMNAVAGNSQPFLSMGTGTALQGLCLRTVDNASAEDEWTTIDLICFKGNSLHIVNGKVVMVLANSRYHENGKDFPMTRGKIQIQSEGAEVFYKDIQIENMDKLPGEYAVYFK